MRVRAEAVSLLKTGLAVLLVAVPWAYADAAGNGRLNAPAPKGPDAERCYDCEPGGEDPGYVCTPGATRNSTCSTACGTGGYQECYADGSGWSPCMPTVARAEVCNGCDDNKDGCVDLYVTDTGGGVESQSVGGGGGTEAERVSSVGGAGSTATERRASSLSSSAGRMPSSCALVVSTRSCDPTGCQTSGRQVCSGGGWSTCTARAEAESCNACDDDLDGLVDNASGTTSPLTRSFTPAGTTCTPGTESCSNGAWGSAKGCGGTTACSTGGSTTCYDNCTVQACVPPAALLWDGNFQALNGGEFPSLRRFSGVDSGARPELVSGQSLRTHPCNGASSSSSGACDTNPDTPSPLNASGQFCPAGDAHCRFIVGRAPDGQSTSQPILKVLTRNGDSQTPSGGTRNELQRPRERFADGSTRDQIIEGDDRYYTWESYIPVARDASGGPDYFPDPPATGGWHVTFQFHEVGLCSGTAPVMTFGLNPVTQNGARVYQWRLAQKQTYSFADSDEMWRDTEPGGVRRGVWYRFILHVKWARTPCSTAACASPPFTTPDGGVMELWVSTNNGPYVRKPLRDDGRRITMYEWPTASYEGYASTSPVEGCRNCDCTGNRCACELNAGYLSSAVGAYMPNVLKTGMYRDPSIREDETIFHQGYRIGTSCAAVTGSSANCP